MFCEECVKTCDGMGDKNIVGINADQKEFAFSVESSGSLKPEEIVFNGLKILENKLNELKLSLPVDKY